MGSKILTSLGENTHAAGEIRQTAGGNHETGSRGGAGSEIGMMEGKGFAVFRCPKQERTGNRRRGRTAESSQSGTICIFFTGSGPLDTLGDRLKEIID